LRSREQLAKLLGGVVDGVRRDQCAVLAAMPSAPHDQLGHIGIVDVGQPSILAEKLDQKRKIVLGIVGANMMLPDFVPVAFGHIIEPQGRLGCGQLLDQRLCLLPLLPLYRFGLASRRLLRASMKPMTFALEVEVEMRRAAVSVLVDGHGTSFRVWLTMNSLRSGSVNILRRRFVPCPMTT